MSDVPGWHTPDIKAALEKRGLSLAQLSRDHGYHETAAAKALRLEWPEMERIIADAIGVAPQQIWPARYSEGVPTKYLPRRQTKARDENGR
jgi:Ner family transcriptional regulator